MKWDARVLSAPSWSALDREVPQPVRTGKGTLGDVIAQIDWCVGEINRTLDRLGLAENSLVIVSSDNGRVLDDGYKDQSAELLGDHQHRQGSS